MKKLSIQVQKWEILKIELSLFDSIAVICFFFKYFCEIYVMACPRHFHILYFRIFSILKQLKKFYDLKT